MGLDIPIYKRSRKYGYVYWQKKMDDEVRSFLKNRQFVNVWFENSFIGEKKIDWTHRRISVGYSRTRKLSSDFDSFQLMFDKKGALKISCS